MRVLHLIDGGSVASVETDAAMLACRAALEQGGPGHVVCLLGPRGATRRAAGLGLRVDVSISPVLGLPEWSWRGVRRMCEALGRPGAMVCWGERASRLAVRALGDAVPLISILTGERASCADSAIVFGVAARERLIGSGMERVRAAVYPAVLSEPGARERVRAALRIGPGEVLIAQLGGPPRANSFRMSFLVGLLAQAGMQAVGVVRPESGQRLRAAAFVRRVAGLRMLTTSLPMPDALAACDIGVLDGGGHGPTADEEPAPWIGEAAISPAHAAGLPVVAPTWAFGGLHADARTAASNSTLTELARVLMPLVQDASLRRELGDEARRAYLRRAAGPGAFARVLEEAVEDLILVAPTAADA